MLEVPFNFSPAVPEVKGEWMVEGVLALEICGACSDGCRGGGGRVAADMWEKSKGRRMRRTGERSLSGAMSSKIKKSLVYYITNSVKKFSITRI